MGHNTLAGHVLSFNMSELTSTTRRPHLPLRGGEIRVLTLHAGEVTDSIVCSLQVAVLDERPEYEALSYTWGDPNVTEKICVDGVEVDVTVNLEIALRLVGSQGLLDSIIALHSRANHRDPQGIYGVHKRTS